MLGKGCIGSPWRLRNDKSYLIAYRCQTDDFQYRPLSPYEAIIATFLDGTLSEDELWFIWHSVVQSSGLAESSLRGIFDQQLKCLRGVGIITECLQLSPTLVEERSSLVPDFAAYKVPIHRLARPLAVSVTLTHYCRTDCVYCYAERKPNEELGLEEWTDIFDELAENEIYLVDVLGGDLFARKDALSLLSEMVKRKFVFFISTKCLIDMRAASRLAEMGIGRPDVAPHLQRPLQISVDSSDPHIADKLVGRKGYLDRARHSIENCIAAGMAPRVKGVLTSLNPDAAEGIVSLFEPLGVRDFHFVQYGRTHYRHDDALFLSSDEKLRLRDQAERIRAHYPHLAFNMQDDSGVSAVRYADWQKWTSRARCSAGRAQMVIKSNGDVTLCDQIPQVDEFVVGNVKETGVISVWQSPRIEQFLAAPRDAFEETPCFDCASFDQCHSLEGRGYCFRDSLFAFGSVFEAPPNCPHQTRVGLRQI